MESLLQCKHTSMRGIETMKKLTVLEIWNTTYSVCNCPVSFMSLFPNIQFRTWNSWNKSSWRLDSYTSRQKLVPRQPYRHPKNEWALFWLLGNRKAWMTLVTSIWFLYFKVFTYFSLFLAFLADLKQGLLCWLQTCTIIYTIAET